MDKKCEALIDTAYVNNYKTENKNVRVSLSFLE